ncbi:OVARIAN TUMOR DOMAIN-containing deubiquitinating enzyme 3 isoform X2 [Aristolochia californica]|uniref:OVARIAN TUMOR DOMAIN-containing deubiquitinating enzyme 3 isoform X2 n=1 Tax=Aristolochia californica TaxID=171875 RepID=UPI0035D5FEF1
MATSSKPFNEVLLDGLRDGSARFELVYSPVASVQTAEFPRFFPQFLNVFSTGLFARIGPSFGGASPAMKKVQHYTVQKVTGDGRCMFRALVKGMAMNKGLALNPWEEKDDADELRMAVKEVICGSEKERAQYEEALIAITVDESLRRYCRSYVVSQLLFIYRSMSTLQGHGAMVLFQFQSMGLNSERHIKEGSQEKQ